MKTVIQISGLDVEFSDQKPTRPGAYWYSVHHELTPSLMHVYESDGGELYVPGEGRLGHWCEVGLWSAPLVPVTEVDAERSRCDSIIKEAHRALGEAIKHAEDIASGRRDDTDLLEVFFVLGREIESRASKVVEGVQ